MHKWRCHKIRTFVPNWIKEFPHCTVPFHYRHKGRQLIAFEEFLDSCFQHPVHSMVVDKYNFAEAVIPKPQHHVNQCFFHHGLTGHNGSGHSQMVIRMSAIVKRRQGQGHFMSQLGRITPHAFAYAAAHECVQAGIIVHSMVFRTP